MAIISTGIALTFQSGYFTDITNISHEGMERAAIETTSFSTTGARTYIPGTLYEPGAFTIEFIFDESKNPVTAIGAAAESVTVTFTDPAPGSTMAAQGFLTNITWAASDVEERVNGTATLKLADDITYTAQ